MACERENGGEGEKRERGKSDGEIPDLMSGDAKSKCVRIPRAALPQCSHLGSLGPFDVMNMMLVSIRQNSSLLPRIFLEQ